MASGEASILELNKTFKALDRLKDPLRRSLKTFDVPFIVVVGATSVGKSTVLRRITKLPFFPEDSDACARVAIKVEVRKPEKGEGAKTSGKLSVWCADKQEYIREHEREVPFEKGVDEVKSMMEEVLRDAGFSTNCVSSKRELHIRVVSEEFPPINIVDLPGIAIAHGENRDAAMTLLKRYAAVPHALFLAVWRVDFFEGEQY